MTHHLEDSRVRTLVFSRDMNIAPSILTVQYQLNNSRRRAHVPDMNLLPTYLAGSRFKYQLRRHDELYPVSNLLVDEVEN